MKIVKTLEKKPKVKDNVFFTKLSKISNVIEHISKEIKKITDEIETCLIDNKCTYKKTNLNEIGQFVKGKLTYTEEYFFDNPGELPVYSSEVSLDVIEKINISGFTNTYDFQTECLKISMCKKILFVTHLPNHKFSINADSFIYKLNDEFVEKINYEFLSIFLKNITKRCATKNKDDYIKYFEIDIPVNEEGIFDLSKQIELIHKHHALKMMKKKVNENLDQLLNFSINRY